MTVVETKGVIEGVIEDSYKRGRGRPRKIKPEPKIRQQIKDIVDDIVNNVDKYKISLSEFSKCFFIHYKRGLIDLSISYTTYDYTDINLILKGESLLPCLKIDGKEILLSEDEKEYIRDKLRKECGGRVVKFNVENHQNQEDLLNKATVGIKHDKAWKGFNINIIFKYS